MSDSYDFDVAIIGCGVGGHGAALHARAQDLKTAVFAGGDVGGSKSKKDSSRVCEVCFLLVVLLLPFSPHMILIIIQLFSLSLSMCQSRLRSFQGIARCQWPRS